MKKLLSTLALSAAILTTPLLSNPASAIVVTDDEITQVCSVFAADYTVRESRYLLSHDEGGAFYSKPIAIPAGTYDIDSLSYEPQHPNDPIPGQENEQWKINLFSDGAIVYTSEATDDMPDTERMLTKQFGAKITLPAVDTIQYVHVGYPENVEDPLKLRYNSIIPACVAFTTVEAEVEEEPVEEEPVGGIGGEVLAEVTEEPVVAPVVLAASTEQLANTGDATTVVTVATGLATSAAAAVAVRRRELV